MTTTATIPVQVPEVSRAEILSYRMLDSTVGAAELLTIHLGHRLGLYEKLLDAGPVTPAQFATIAGVAERYAREWLEQQAAACILDVVPSPESADERAFFLPAEHVPVLIDPESPFHMTGAASLISGIAQALPHVASAFRSGTGVSFSRFGGDLRSGIAALNRPSFVHGVEQWIEMMPDIAERLRAGGTVLDAGCGEGWSSIALARAFPNARVIGIDLDPSSVSVATLHAQQAGVADRIEFGVADAAEEGPLADLAPERYALVTVFEALHDMGSPIRALDAMRSVLAPGGAVLVAEERVAEEFTPAADELERLFYAMSVLHCVPATMAQSSSIVNGTVLRAKTLARWARSAGFLEFDELPIPHDFWRFYRLN